MKLFNIFLLLLSLLLMSPVVLAHGNYLNNINLDFDSVAKEKIVKEAQNYLKVKNRPVSFDYAEELILVKLNDFPLKSVAVNGFDYTIHGMTDNTLKAKTDKIKTTKEQRRTLVEAIFRKIPKKYQDELKYGEERSEGVLFTHTWYRYKDNIVIPKERLEVTIDGRNGKVVHWQLNIFFKDKELLETTPAITAEVAEEIVKLKFKAKSLNFDPILIIHDGKPVWITKMKVLYPIFIGVSAQDGEILFTGGMRGTLPDNYNVGKESPIIESQFIKNIYGGKND